MLTVACVLRSGGIYDAGWVARLAAGVRRHLSAPVHFVCLTDMFAEVDAIEGVDAVRLNHDWPGWWSKMELFTLPGHVLAVDLDTLIIGGIGDVASQALMGRFTILRDFYRPEGLGSGLMSWSASARPIGLYEAFAQDPARWMKQCDGGGDQEFIEIITGKEGVTRWQDLLPGQVVSYKAHNCTIAAPEGARIMCLHGKPKFPDMPADSWARRAWEALA